MFKFVFTIEEYLKVKALFNACSDDFARRSLTYVYYRGAMDKSFVSCNGHLLRIEKFSLEDREADCFPSENILLSKNLFCLTKKQILDMYGKYGPVVVNGGIKEYIFISKEHEEKRLEKLKEEIKLKHGTLLTEQEMNKFISVYEDQMYGPEKESYPNFEKAIWDDSMSGPIECVGFTVENLKNMLATFYPEPFHIGFRYSGLNSKAVKLFVAYERENPIPFKYCGVIMPTDIKDSISKKIFQITEIKPKKPEEEKYPCTV